MRKGAEPALERHATLPITRFMFMLERMHVVIACAVQSLTVRCWLEMVGPGPGPDTACSLCGTHSMSKPESSLFESWE